MSYISDYLPICEHFEGVVPYMYLDSATPPNVTVGVGFLIPSALTANAYPFRLPGGLLANQDEIDAAFNKVKAMESGKIAPFYAYVGCLTLAQTDIDTHLMAVLEQTDATLQRDFTDFPDFPDAAKMALLDMEYNLGETKLRHTYPRFNAAVESKNWATAATECHRNGINNERNQWTSEQFTIAANAQ